MIGSTLPAVEPASARPRPGMVWVPGGSFTMGSDRHYPEESPAHQVTVDGFWMNTHPVTNDEFAEFVDVTGHVTLAERPPDPAVYPDAEQDLLVPASSVFTPPALRVDLRDAYQWWSLVAGAQWRHPRGPGSSLVGLGAHPVTHLAWPDVAAYVAWAGKDLATEAEWEFAARGGGMDTEYAWGTELTPGGQHQANVWQGAQANPSGGHQAASVEFGSSIPRKVMKGGSYLCAPNYCRRYRPAARLPQPVDTSTCHLGFRCVVRPVVAER